MAPGVSFTRSGRRAGVATLAALAVATVAGPPALAGSGSGSAGSGGGGGTADVALSVNYQPPTSLGHVVRGGLLACTGCTTSVEPRYRVTGFTPGWDSNTLSLVSLNGFSGTVTLSVTGLPFGVASETATTVTVPRRGAASTRLRLRAAGFAAEGTATVTVTAAAGGKVHTVALPVSVADALPAW